MSAASFDLKILDGGLGSELQRRGHAIEGEPLWSGAYLVKDPRSIHAIHTSFLESGADIIETASYQISLHGLHKHLGLKVSDAKNVIKSSVNIAREARDKFWDKLCSDRKFKGTQEREKPLVAGSVGPYGVVLHDGSEYTGSYIPSMSLEELMDWHRPRMAILVDAGVDYIAFETIPAAAEGVALVRLLREFPGTKAWLSFSCKDGLNTSYGDLYRTAVKKCLSLAPQDQLVAIGVNCCYPENVCSLLTSATKERGCLKAIAYPNSGEDWVSGQGWSSPRENTRSIQTYVASWINCGANWVGGCCRVTPDDIAAIKEEALHLVKAITKG